MPGATNERAIADLIFVRQSNQGAGHFARPAFGGAHKHEDKHVKSR